MKQKGKKLRVKRVFSEEFKKHRVQDYESGSMSAKEIAKLYGVHFQTVYNWIYKYSLYNKKGLKIVEMADSSYKKIKELESKIKELERMVGKKQIKIDYLEELLSVAKEELELDLKKNSDTPQS